MTGINGVHPKAVVSGEVVMGTDVQVWPGAVVKGPVRLGDGSVVLDNAFVSGGEVGAGSVLSPNCVVVDSVIGSECLIGPRARVLDGAKLGDVCVVEAGVLIRGLGFDGFSVVGGDPPGYRGLVDGSQRELLRKKREEFRERFASYGALSLIPEVLE